MKERSLPVFRDSGTPPSPRRIGRWIVFSLFVHFALLVGILQVEFAPEPGMESPGGHAPDNSVTVIRKQASGSEREDPQKKVSLSGDRESGPRKTPIREAEIRGRLALEGGSTAGFRVVAKRSRGGVVLADAPVDAAGRFVLRLLPSGSYELSLLHEDRVLARIRVEIQSGSIIGLEWRSDLRVRRVPARENIPDSPLTPDVFWKMVREPGARKWRRNLENMLRKSGTSPEALLARRRAELRWDQIRVFVSNLGRILVRITGFLFPWARGGIGVPGLAV